MLKTFCSLAALVCLSLAIPARTYGNVFGTNHRVPIRSTHYPWTAIGEISTGGTGTLVGRNLVLTAAHVVLDERGHVKRSIYFYPNMINHRARTQSRVVRVWLGTSDPQGHRSDDWAILELDRNLGDVYGWMGFSTHLPVNAMVAGYANDFAQGTASVDLRCRFRGMSGTLLLHDGATARGCSGGPIFEKQGETYRIVALVVSERRMGGQKSLHLAQYDARFANLAIPVTRFADTLRRLKGEERPVLGLVTQQK
jgi:V8-like Glu-specific endopeptidase